MNYIYGYRNKINNKWYVGQTTLPLMERHRLHISGATHPKASDYNCLFHKKIREYGIDNFELIVLEEVENKEDLDSKEQYWIKEKNSFIKNNGYNLTTGGQSRKQNENYWDNRCLLTPEQAQEVINLLFSTNIPQTEIAEQFKVSRSIINQINSGKKYRLLKDEEYPIRKSSTTITPEETVEVIIELLKQGYGNTEICDMLGNNLLPNTVSAINNGTKHKKNNLDYPIRKETNIAKNNREKAELIIKYLEENILNNKQIAEKVQCDPSVVSRINSGKTYYDHNRKYPIRK